MLPCCAATGHLEVRHMPPEGPSDGEEGLREQLKCLHLRHTCTHGHGQESAWGSKFKSFLNDIWFAMGFCLNWYNKLASGFLNQEPGN